MNTAVLTPAYGRDYKSAAEAIADFHANKDFIIRTITDKWVGKPCNKSDLLQYADYNLIEIRFNKNQDATIVRLSHA